METLFNIEVSQFDLAPFIYNVGQSSLESPLHEQELVDYIFTNQEEQLQLIELAEAYAEEIIANSRESIYTRMSQVESTGRPSVSISIGNLDPIGINNSYGLITENIVSDSYSQYYWKMGEYVEILNNPIVPSGVTISIDSMITRDILSGFFLQNIPGEILSRCTTSAIIGGNLKDSSIEDDRAIRYGDIKTFFYLKTDYVDTSIKNVRAGSYYLSQDSLSVENVDIPSRIIATKITSESGMVTLKNFNEEFLLRDGYIMQDAFLSESIETNTVALIDGILNLQENYAPKKNWIAKDLRKTDRKTEAFMDTMIGDVVGGIAPSNNVEFDSMVCMEELLYTIGKTMEMISDIGVCDDS